MRTRATGGGESVLGGRDPPWAESEFFVNAGTVYPYSQAWPGDLLFWGSRGSTDHVAIYLGNGQMLEAAPPRGTGSVHQTGVYGTHDYVVRMFNWRPADVLTGGGPPAVARSDDETARVHWGWPWRSRRVPGVCSGFG